MEIQPLELADFLAICKEHNDTWRSEPIIYHQPEDYAHIPFILNFYKKLVEHICFVFANKLQPVFLLADKNGADKCDIELRLFETNSDFSKDKTLFLKASMYEDCVTIFYYYFDEVVEFGMGLSELKHTNKDELEAWFDNEQKLNSLIWWLDLQTLKNLLSFFAY